MYATIRFIGIALMLGNVLPICRAAPPATAPAAPGVKAEPFPIGVWCQDPVNARKYKAIGINRYVALWEGPTSAQLSALEKAGMPVICDQNAEALKPRWQQEIIGWLQQDEPDNAQDLPDKKGYGPPITPEKIVQRYQTMKAADPTRPILLGLGQGVAWDGWYGRGVRTNKPEDYPRYALGADILAFDIYPINHESKEIVGKLWYVGHGVDRLVAWTNGKKPVWFDIECTHISGPNAKIKPTPDQVKVEVWMAIIHGARGIDYFVHQFEPKFIEAALLADPEMSQAVAQINAQIQDLSPVLQSPAPDSLATWELTGGDKTAIAAITRRLDKNAYVLAVGMSPQTVHATFHLPAVQGSVEVLSESRQIPLKDAQWTDTFAGYQVHLYRLGVSSSEHQISH